MNNVLARAARARLISRDAPRGGGGPFWFHYQRRIQRDVLGCAATVAITRLFSAPAFLLCGGATGTRRTRGHSLSTSTALSTAVSTPRWFPFTASVADPPPVVASHTTMERRAASSSVRLASRQSSAESSDGGGAAGHSGKKPFLIGVAGGTASGKTTVCARIMEAVKSADGGACERQIAAISQDSFYRDLTQEESARASKGIDCQPKCPFFILAVSQVCSTSTTRKPSTTRQC